MFLSVIFQHFTVKLKPGFKPGSEKSTYYMVCVWGGCVGVCVCVCVCECGWMGVWVCVGVCLWVCVATVRCAHIRVVASCQRQYCLDSSLYDSCGLVIIPHCLYRPLIAIYSGGGGGEANLKTEEYCICIFIIKFYALNKFRKVLIAGVLVDFL